MLTQPFFSEQLKLIETAASAAVHTLEREFEANVQDRARFSQQLERAQAAATVVKEIQARISTNTVQFLSTFLTRGVATVFSDKDLEVHVQVGSRGNTNTASIVVIQNINGQRVEASLTQACGGGVQVICAFLLQILVIINRDLARVVFIDEFFTQVSKDYRDGLFDLLEMLTKEYGFSFLLISHDQEFIHRADTIYIAQDGQIRKQG